jgi:two-component system sensor histidine kinase KdpD
VTDRNRQPNDERPDPDALLERYNLRDVAPEPGAGDSSRRARGRLRIYLGMAAGVGKTFAMLGEGQRRKSRGTDVVIGWVDTHKRPLTEAQIGDLEIIPRKRIAYRGVEMEEMDLDAILARRPAVVLVDELAHTNVPGSRHDKRYEDVEDLLVAGITVITTVNIQHLESLNDLVEAITGARQRETIPDSLLDEADEVELVDISPEALRARLRHGNVYPPERATQALERYFSMSNLTALRELALRRVSEKTERQLETIIAKDVEARDLPQVPAPADRVLVAFDASDDEARRLLHEGARLARGLRATFLAITVRPASGPSKGQLGFTQLAEDLGAEVIEVTSGGESEPNAARIADAIAKAARERQATLLVLGRPRILENYQSGWLARLAGREAPPSVVERLLRMELTASLHVVMRQR